MVKHQESVTSVAQLEYSITLSIQVSSIVRIINVIKCIPLLNYGTTIIVTKINWLLFTFPAIEDYRVSQFLAYGILCIIIQYVCMLNSACMDMCLCVQVVHVYICVCIFMYA